VALRFGHLFGAGLHEVGRPDLYPAVPMLRSEDEETLTEWDDILVRVFKCLCIGWLPVAQSQLLSNISILGGFLSLDMY